MHVVLAHQRPVHFADLFAVEEHRVMAGVRRQLLCTPGALFPHQLLLAPAAHRHHLLQVAVVVRQDDLAFARHQTHQVVELFLDGFQIVEDIGVVELQVIHDQRARAVMHELGALVEERAVIFVGLDHEERAAAETGRYVEVARHAADDEAGLVAAGLEDPGRHAGGGGFAVGAGNRQYPAIAQHGVVQPLRAGNVRDATFQHRLHARVAARHGVADDHQIRRRIQLGRIITLNKIDPLVLQQRAHRRIDVGVRTGDVMPQ